MVRKNIIETKKVLQGGKNIEISAIWKKQKENTAKISAHS